VVEAVVVPDALPHEMSKVKVVAVETVKGPTVSEPVTDLFPDHEFPATQRVAFADAHERVTLPPLVIADGLTENEEIVVVATVEVPVSLSKFTIETSDGFTPFQLTSALDAAPRSIAYVMSPSIAASSTPVTVTVWNTLQFAGVNVRSGVETMPSLVSELETGIATSARGAESRTTVNDAVDSYSDVERPAGAVTDTVPVAVPPGGFTTSDAELVAVPAVFVHERINVSVVTAVTANGPTASEPETALLPPHAPDAVQEVAPVVAHVIVADAPEATGFGDTESAEIDGVTTTITGAGFIVREAELVVVPVLFEQERPKVSVVVAVTVNGPTARELDVATGPDHAPDAVHEVAPVVVHVSVEPAPESIGFGLAENDAIEGADPDTVPAVAVIDDRAEYE
jgi:hypothetical protein